MNENPGYRQAVENMAYRISAMSQRDFDPLAEKYGDDKDLMLADFHANGDPKDIQEWDRLETIADIVCNTYEVEYDNFMSDVWNYMVFMIISEPEFTH